MLLLFLSVALAAEPPGELTLADLTREVLAVNPEVAQAQAALDQARARTKAAGPWPDPMIDLSTAPLSFVGMPGWQVEVRQDLPLWGERRAAAAMAAGDADAAAADLEMMRLDLADMAAMAWADWYSLDRESALIARTRAKLDEVRAAVVARVGTGRATDLDVLQIDAERGWLSTQARSIATERDVAAYRINTLLHRDAEAVVLPPPSTLPRPELPSGEARRPELAETAAMTRAAEAEERMARADRLPMLGAMAGWDSMQAMPEDRLMVGLSVRVPLDQRARSAAVDAGTAGVAVARAAEQKAQDTIAGDIAIAERRFRGQAETLDLLEQEVLPIARARVAAARDAYASGSADVRQVLEAERGALDAEVRREEALALLVVRAREVDLARGIPFPGDAP